MKTFINKNLCLVFNEDEKINLEEFFAYIYDYSLSTSQFFSKIDIASFLTNEYESLIVLYKKLSGLDVYKKWWLYHLIVLKEEAKTNDLKYLYNAINKMIYTVNEIEIELLIGYVNAFNESLFDMSGAVLSIRPKEYYRVSKDVLTPEDSNYLPLPNFKDIADVIRKYVKDEDIKADIVETLDKDKFKEYITIHELMAEFFVSIILASLDHFSISDENINTDEVEEERQNMLNTIVSEFVNQSFKLNQEESKNLICELRKLIKIQ